MGKPQTLLAARLSEKGITARDTEFRLAVAKFQNNGGAYDDALTILRQAFGLPDRSVEIQMPSHVSRERVKELMGGFVAQTETGEVGQRQSADKATARVPTSPINPSDAGRVLRAERSAKAQPSHAKRGAVAMASVQAAVSRSLFDTTLLPDGRKLREVRWSECPNLAGKYRKLSRILMAVHNHAVPPDPNARLDTLVNEEGLKDIIANVERFNDLH